MSIWDSSNLFAELDSQVNSNKLYRDRHTFDIVFRLNRPVGFRVEVFLSRLLNTAIGLSIGDLLIVI